MRMEDNALKSIKLEMGRKIFFLDLKENERGRFLKITEDVGGRRDTIIVPDEGLEDLYNALGDILDEIDGE
ncbi:MAG: DNA-binding protein [Verrucomicrobiia bacterium]